MKHTTVVEISCIEAWLQISRDDRRHPAVRHAGTQWSFICATAPIARRSSDGARNTVQLPRRRGGLRPAPPGFSERLLKRLAIDFGGALPQPHLLT